jgi:hypothetical protein
VAMDLLDFLSKGLGGEFVSRVSGLIGENSQGTQNALDAALPLLVAGAARKASTPEGASDLLGLLNRNGTDPAQLASIGKLLSGSNLGSLTTAGTNILTGLFGDRTGSLGGALGNLAGIRPGSATTLLTTLSPLVFGLLRAHASREGLGATGLATLLMGQRDTLARRVPAGLTGALGWGSPSTWFGPPRAPVAPVVAQQAGPRWVHWIVAALVALGLLFMVTRCGRETPVPPVPGAPAVATAPGTVKLYFDVGSAAPAADTAAQLSAIVAYARVNPGARVSVSGYNDPSGDAAANQELAKNRALAVRNVLVGAGVSEAQVDMDRPIVATGVAGDREARRVEVSVR